MVKKLAYKENKIKNKPFDFILFIDVLLLLALGIVMVLSASSPSALAEKGDSYYYVKTQAFSAVLGLFFMYVISKIDYRKYKKINKWWFYIISVVLLLLVLVPGIGYSAKGATRWIDLKVTTLQPSEIVKVLLIMFFAMYLSEHRKSLKELVPGFVIPIALVSGIILILVLVQNHLSASFVILAIVSIMMLMAGSRLVHFLSIGSVGLIGGISALYIRAKATGSGGFRITRIISFLDPWKDAQDSGYQIIQGLYAIGSGGLFGLGLGQSKQKYLYIPEPHNDFIFAVLAEELGFLGCIVVLLLFGIFIWRGLVIAMKAPDMFGSLVAIGITSLVGIQVVMNIAVVTASIPNTGIPLPFFSYGGTALLILLCSVGILLSISRAGNKV